jgi:histidinol-phosphate/aromatic aminotransferase/cobyric acid decarboxylase-like protein
MRLQRGVNIIAARVAAAALDDSDYTRLSSRRNADQRQEFYNQTNARMLRQIDSLTNFVFTKVGLPSSQVIEHFERHRIILGPVIPEMKTHVRVAISTEENMKEFWRVWDLLPSMSHKAL